MILPSISIALGVSALAITRPSCKQTVGINRGLSIVARHPHYDSSLHQSVGARQDDNAARRVSTSPITHHEAATGAAAAPAIGNRARAATSTMR